jgi:hypothetical protein
MLMLSDGVVRTARGSESEEQRGGKVNPYETKRPEICGILFCEPGKSQGGGQSRVCPRESGQQIGAAPNRASSRSSGKVVSRDDGWNQLLFTMGSARREYLPFEGELRR